MSNPYQRTGSGVSDDKTLRVILSSDSPGAGAGSATPTDVAIARGVGIAAGDVVNGSVAVNTSNATYTALGSAVCSNVLFTNNTGATLDLAYGGVGVAIQIFDKQSLVYPTNGNANKVSVKRNAGSGALTLTYQILP